MKTLLLIVVFGFLIGSLSAQDKYFTRTGHIYIISATPLLDLEADNNQVASILDIKTGELVFTLLMKSFIFKEALAQDHFNENYVESDKYPKAGFSGKILQMENLDLSKAGKYNVIVEGDLTIHGQKNKVKSKGTIEVKNDLIIAQAKFEINVYDYGIKIPKLVQDKVNKIIPITVEMKYKPYNK